MLNWAFVVMGVALFAEAVYTPGTQWVSSCVGGLLIGYFGMEAVYGRR